MFFNNGSQTRSRRFDYPFRYYDPEKDKSSRIEFRRIRTSSEPQRGSLLRLLIMFLLMLFALIYIGKKGFHFSFQKETKPNVIKVEEIRVVD
jgi:hypothetical protein